MNHINPNPRDQRHRHDAERNKGRARQGLPRDTRWDVQQLRERDRERERELRDRETPAARKTRWDMPTYRGNHRPHAREPRQRWQPPADLYAQEDDREFTQRQLAGLNMLMAIAEPEIAFVPFSGTTVRMHYTGPFEVLDRPVKEPQPRSAPDAPKTSGRLGAIWAFVRTDQMLRNSLYLVLNSGVQAILGFGFWIITARLFSTESVGKASSLISATTLIAFLGLLGLNTAIVRYLPITRKRNNLITVSLSLVALSCALIAVIYLALIPFISQPLAFVVHSLPMAIGFVILTAGGGLNVLTDSIFVAAGKANYNAIVDGIVGGTAKIILIVLLAGTGAYGVFGAATGGFVAAAVASVFLMVKMLRWRPAFGEFGRVLKPILHFSGMNYIGNVLNLLPNMIVPLIVISRVGTSAAAYYYVSFQLASLLYAAAYSVEQAFLAEGAQTGTVSRAVLMRSARILLALCIPAFIVVMLFGHLLLAAFGSKYAANGESSLIPLTAAVLPIAAYNWSLTVLRLGNQLRAIVWSNFVYAAAIIGVALVLAPRGLGAVALSWPVGATAGAIVAGGSAARSLRRSRPAMRQRDARPVSH